MPHQTKRLVCIKLIKMETLSTGHSKEQVKEIMKSLAIEFMQIGFNQIEACKMAKETILNNYSLFKQ